MATSSEITRLTNAKASLKSSIEAKGVPIASTDKLDDYASKVDLIETPDATIYSGTTDPSSSLGEDGDLYIKL